MAHFLEVHSPQRAPSRHELSMGPITWGGAKGDAVRLPGLLEARTIQGEVDESGVLLRVDPGSPNGLVFEGEVYWELRAPWGSEIYWGAYRFVLLRGEETSSQRSVRLFSLVGLGIVGLWCALSMTEGSEGHAAPDVAAPSILSRESSCPGDVAEALHRARMSEARARSKAARFGFSKADGVQAERLYAEAQRCFAVGGETTEASRVEGELTRHRERLVDEYRTQRVRLRIALDGKRYRDAWAAARELGELLEAAEIEEDEPYRRWLLDLARRLRERVEKDGR